MKKSLILQDFGMPDIHIEDGVSEEILDDFIACSNTMGFTRYEKKYINCMNEKDLKAFGDQSIKDHLNNFFKVNPNYKDNSLVITMRYDKINIINWAYEEDRERIEISKPFIRLGIDTRKESEIYKGMLNKFNINGQWDFNKCVWDHLKNTTVCDLDVVPGFGINFYMVIESDCFRRCDNVYYNHFISFKTFFNDIDTMSLVFKSVRECTEYFKDYFDRILDGRKSYLEVAAKKIPIIEQEMLKDKYWEVPEKYYKTDYYSD